MRRPPIAALVLLCLLVVSCTTDSRDEVTSTTVSVPPAAQVNDVEDPPAPPPTDDADVKPVPIVEQGADHDEIVSTFVALLPPDTSAVTAIDVDALMSGDSADSVAQLIGGEGDPFLGQIFDVLGALTPGVDLTESISTAVLAQTTNGIDGSAVVAQVDDSTADRLAAAAATMSAGRRMSLLPGNVLVAGSIAVVDSVIEASEQRVQIDTGALTPFLSTLDADGSIAFVLGMPALFDAVSLDRSLRSASVISGSFVVADDAFSGGIAFHTHDGREFVETYNLLDRNAIETDQSPALISTGGTGIDGLDSVLVTVPPMPLDPTPEEERLSRNLFKKLFVGVEAHDYAEEVAERDQEAWLDFRVRSEADPEPTAGSVYIRWEFKDQSAIEAFEADELPAGFRLAPTQFLETDDPAGEYFFALNLYNAGGGSIVSGARAEWDVFVHAPDGADPNAGERPRFGVVDVLAEEVSADSGNLLTLAEPVSHQLVDGRVVSDVSRFGPEGDELSAFASNFPVPDPATAEIARFTREMAIGNDYIYWAHGVSDRVLYNATTFNHDAYFVDIDDSTFVDSTRWADYLKPEIKDAVYYVNTLEYVASPMSNLDSEFLDIEPDWLANLQAFTTNGHQEGLMRTAVEQLFRGAGDALVGFEITNESPATFFHFEIDDPEAMAAAIDLPAGSELTPATVYAEGPEAYYLTLSVYEIDGAIEGTRAEWSVTTDDGSGRPDRTVIDVMTANVGFDPLTIINLPDDVRHEITDGTITTRLNSPTVQFDASLSTAEVTDHELSLDWIESSDRVCSLNGICDRFYYDAETLDVPVHQPADVTITSFESPWSEFVSDAPSVVFYRDNAQEYVVGRWYDLDVPIDELPFDGLANATHDISGGGALVGRTSAVGDSTYTYAGDAIVDDDEVTFAIDQTIVNALGEGHIFTTGTFELATGQGTQTVVDCQGPSLLCSDIEPGATAFYTAQNLEGVNSDVITWQVDVAVDLGASFGIADSASSFTASQRG